MTCIEYISIEDRKNLPELLAYFRKEGYRTSEQLTASDKTIGLYPDKTYLFFGTDYLSFCYSHDRKGYKSIRLFLEEKGREMEYIVKVSNRYLKEAIEEFLETHSEEKTITVNDTVIRKDKKGISVEPTGEDSFILLKSEVQLLYEFYINDVIRIKRYTIKRCPDGITFGCTFVNKETLEEIVKMIE